VTVEDIDVGVGSVEALADRRRKGCQGVRILADGTVLLDLEAAPRTSAPALVIIENLLGHAETRIVPEEDPERTVVEALQLIETGAVADHAPQGGLAWLGGKRPHAGGIEDDTLAFGVAHGVHRLDQRFDHLWLRLAPVDWRKRRELGKVVMQAIHRGLAEEGGNRSH
jgi:hypothetical protein